MSSSGSPACSKPVLQVVNFSYGGASLPSDILHRIQTVAEKTVGERIAFCSGLASTETTGCGTYCGWATDDTGNIGVPAIGTEVKLVPLEGNDGRYEIRVRGSSVFSGYVNRPDLTATAFDDEGYFCLGDAVRLASPKDPAGKGLRFAGRVSEDFKLTNGTWVRTGAVRVALLEQCAPLLSDAVICHDHDYSRRPRLAKCPSLPAPGTGIVRTRRHSVGQTSDRRRGIARSLVKQDKRYFEFSVRRADADGRTSIDRRQ